MDFLNFDQIAQLTTQFLPLLATVALLLFFNFVIKQFLKRKMQRTHQDNRFSQQIYALVFFAILVVAAVVTAPFSDETQGQLLSLIGILFTAIITLSSTSIMSNAMAGLMLRFVNNFSIGDYIHVGDQFGRVTEQGLFHTEIQTEDRDLTTLPNNLLIKDFVKVIHNSGTIVSCTISLGYDLHHKHIESLLVEAAEATDLEDPFVYVKELGDFSVVYRVSGFLANTRNLLTIRSVLRCNVLDILHEHDIEIVSPSYMYQKPMSQDEVHIAKRNVGPSPKEENDISSSPEEVMFDKAISAETIERLKQMREELTNQIKELDKTAPKSQLENKKKRILKIDQAIKDRQLQNGK